MMGWVVAAWIGLASSAEGPVVATASTWPSWRGDGLQRGVAPGSLPNRLVSRWTQDVGEGVVGGAVVDEKRVYVGDKSGVLTAVDRHTGGVRWQVAFGGAIEAPPLLLGGVIVVGSKDGTVRALEVVTGAERWRFDAGAEVIAAVAYAPPSGPRPGLLLVGAYDGDLHAITTAGKQVWSYATGSYLYGSAAVDGQTAVFGGCDGYVHTLKLVDGSVVSKVEVGAYVGASVAREADEAYVGHFGNKVIRFSPTTGAVAWSHFDRAFPYLSSPALTDKLVVLGGRDHMVRALERATGEVWWLFPARGKVESSPVIVGDRVVVGSEDGRLYVLTLADGEAKQSFDLGAPVTATPAVASGWVFVGAGDGVLHAYGPPPGKEKP